MSIKGVKGYQCPRASRNSQIVVPLKTLLSTFCHLVMTTDYYPKFLLPVDAWDLYHLVCCGGLVRFSNGALNKVLATNSITYCAWKHVTIVCVDVVDSCVARRPQLGRREIFAIFGVKVIDNAK